MTWLVMQRSVWNDIVSWRIRRLSNSTKYLLLHRWPPLQRRRNKICWRIVTSTCSQIVLKCLYLASIGRPDILWSVNKLARAITKWTKAKETCANTNWRDSQVRASSNRCFCNWDVKKYRIANVYLFIESKDCSDQYTWMTSKWWEEAEYGSHVEEIDEKCRCWQTDSISSTMCIWDAHNVNANRTKLLLNNTRRCLNHVFLLKQLKNYQVGKTWRKNHDVVLRHGRIWDTTNWGAKRRSNCTKFRVLAWMIIKSRRKSLKQLENRQKYAHKLSCSVCTWPELMDPTLAR